MPLPRLHSQRRSRVSLLRSRRPCVPSPVSGPHLWSQGKVLRSLWACRTAAASVACRCTFKGALWCFHSFVVPILFFFGFAVLWVALCNVVGCVSAVGMSSLMLGPGWFVFAGMGPNGKQEVRDLVLLAAIDQWPNRQADWLYAREQLDPLPWIRLGKFCSLFGNCTMPIAVVKWKQWLTMCSADIR